MANPTREELATWLDDLHTAFGREGIEKLQQAAAHLRTPVRVEDVEQALRSWADGLLGSEFSPFSPADVSQLAQHITDALNT